MLKSEPPPRLVFRNQSEWALKRSSLRDLASGMRKLAGTKTTYRRAYAAPLAGLNADCAEYRSRRVHRMDATVASRHAG